MHPLPANTPYAVTAEVNVVLTMFSSSSSSAGIPRARLSAERAEI